jgi:hypothetical protein
MIGQSFSPFNTGGGQDDPRQAQQGSGSPIQQVIQILKLRMPHVFGAGAPAPGSLMSPGAAMMPPRPSQPTPLPMPGGMPPSPMGGPSMPFPGPLPTPRVGDPFGAPSGGGGGQEPPKPVIHYQPPPTPPGGTAGPGPGGGQPPQPFRRPRPAPTRVPR